MLYQHNRGRFEGNIKGDIGMMEELATKPQSVEEQLAPHLDDEFVLFIHSKPLLQQIKAIMENLLNFKKVSVVAVGNTKKEFIEKLSKILMTSTADVLVAPSLATKSNEQETKIDVWNNFLVNMHARINQTKNDKEKTLNCMSKMITVLEEAENYIIREKYIRMFAGYRIPSVFIFSHSQSGKLAEQVAERHPVLADLLAEHLTNSGSAIEKIKEKEDELELNKKKAEADKLMKQGQDYKESRNYAEAVACFEKAIQIMPSDPELYLESGKGFTKLKKYSRAVRRFTEAEEVAKDIPAPNMEIGNVKIIQVKEMVANGADPDGEDISKLLSEASRSFKSALDKADALKPLHDEDKTDRGAEAVSSIARSLSEHALSETLGSENAIVKEFHSMVGRSLKNKGIKDSAEISTPARITLGLVAADEGDFEGAEKLLFTAMEDKKYISDASWGLNYLGAQIRKAKMVDEAFRIYNRLLEFDPPNRAAVYFNISVAWLNKGNKVESAGNLVEAVYTDPGLPHDEMFTRNIKLMELYNELLEVFTQVKVNSKTMKPVKEPEAQSARQPEPADMHSPKPNPEFSRYKANFEKMIKGDRQKSMKVIFDFTKRERKFFESFEFFCSGLIMGVAREAFERIVNVDNPQANSFKAVIKETFEKEKNLALPSTARFQAFRAKLEEIAVSDKKLADRRLYDISVAEPGFFASVEAYESTAVMELVLDAFKRFKDVDNPKIKKFVRFLERVIERKEKYSPKAKVELPDEEKFEQLIISGKVKDATEFLRHRESESKFLDTPKMYENEAVLKFASDISRKHIDSEKAELNETAKILSAFLDNREKYIKFQGFVEAAFQAYMETMDQRKMTNSIAKAICSFPESVDKQYFYENSEMVNAALEIEKKLSGKGVGEAYR